MRRDKFRALREERLSSTQPRVPGPPPPSPRDPAPAWTPPPPPHFNPLNLQSWVSILVLGPVFINFADGCIRRSLFTPQTTTLPPPTPTPASALDDTTATTMATSHKQACLDSEVQEMNCLHGGTCYTVVVNDNRQSLCHCTEDWTGERCEQVYIDPAILANMEQNMRTANIAAGVSVCILVLFVLLLAIYVYLRKKRKGTMLSRDRSQESQTLAPNGTTGDGHLLPGPPLTTTTNCHVHVTIDADGAMTPPPSGGDLPPPYSASDEKPPQRDAIDPTALLTPSGKESTL